MLVHEPKLEADQTTTSCVGTLNFAGHAKQAFVFGGLLIYILTLTRLRALIHFVEHSYSTRKCRCMETNT